MEKEVVPKREETSLIVDIKYEELFTQSMVTGFLLTIVCKQ